ncbi:glucose-6-phosphatase 3 [Paramormyrops kingsleyae]|uniref:Glucose-6-phosphatase n=1 Tax=Paramormyrops kingsleyae TaxID=1676925 RepID=A0A3B3QA92_9TELE|nr:glucose-6-phosphatase 3 [Paramormyrops kingsleyae]XP_023676600.1 glucose-6-phosphatase 3 [Paramormyrops kingsleyae]XP_023676601.1 glucose-6-phosphatase 3 [Paramormyrops kingsleyae]XP_023676602.1 glucose-6-phosphatase 3 [Paramormyrops kingsleyae]XP_023676603.1 glucose-6-phosphatase 3 [Paramormyrops kingsleyae]XP_023676604.1 glucose-6-phosphatase 3 [Paramormyrops kingsleyae]
MQSVHTQGIWMAEALQKTLADYEDVWLFVTHMGDPKAAFLLCFPVTYYLSRRTGVAVLWVAAISEWLNLMFKWVLFGERPFWWIGESRLFGKNPPQVRQFSTTCETGPGSPSGHAMVTSAVCWVMASTLASFLYLHTRSVLLRAAPYLLYVVVLVAVGISRVFTLAHFPHQVIAGSLTGITIGVFLNRVVPEGRPLRFFFHVSMGLLLGSLLLYTGLEYFGINLSWSIALAMKWCSHLAWIRLDTAPFSSLTRDCGSMLGLGLAQYWKPGGWSLPWTPRALCVALSSMALYHMNRVALPTSPPLLFYSLIFIRFTLVPQVVMVFVPGLVHHLTAKKKKD